jgi:predicted ATPase
MSTPFTNHIKPQNFLSFGPDNPGIDLLPLNVLIGPNGCGKSNLIEAISLMRAAASDFGEITRKGGGTAEWIWKGNPDLPATVEWITDYPRTPTPQPLRHAISFRAISQMFTLVDERVENEKPIPPKEDVYFYYRFQHGSPILNVHEDAQPRRLNRENIETDKSIIAQRKDPDAYPELAWLAKNYENIRIYRDWTFGPKANYREWQPTDLRTDKLAEDFSNLGLFLSRFASYPKEKRAILAALSELSPEITDFNVRTDGGRVHIFLTVGDYAIPAYRLSDGTLRYLCLLCILLDPTPPPLICLEEPELGLHPDVLPNLASLLKDASTRAQLIVTTHSALLVDALSDTHKSIVVCEKHDNKTTMKRLDSIELRDWINEYGLKGIGNLWNSGDIGGNRW